MVLLGSSIYLSLGSAYFFHYAALSPPAIAFPVVPQVIQWQPRALVCVSVWTNKHLNHTSKKKTKKKKRNSSIFWGLYALDGKDSKKRNGASEFNKKNIMNMTNCLLCELEEILVQRLQMSSNILLLQIAISTSENKIQEHFYEF